MTIEKIICQNSEDNTSHVLVRFNNKTNQPTSIMCPAYKTGKCLNNYDGDPESQFSHPRPCIYAKWKKI
ncbi:hypothetical protein M0R19_06780 [Candidatus Pacearchaeota archaeon]|nr:hypothetical protein [Candidatus Pacearchaeota archaeon]